MNPHYDDSEKGFFNIILDIMNYFVELYLFNAIRPFLFYHEQFYTFLNDTIRSILNDNSDKIPKWCTANFITYVRTIFVIPCVMLIVNDYIFLPSFIVLLVDFADFVDGVIARYWEDVHNSEDLEKLVTEEDSSSKDKPKKIDSWVTSYRKQSFGEFIDAICDKAFLIPCWIVLLGTVPLVTHFQMLQYVVLWLLIFTEISSGCVRFKAYYTCNGVAMPVVQGFDFSTSAVKADHIGKAKQTFEMVGTAFYIIHWTRYFGLFLLIAALPLAYESLRRKIKERTIYVDGTEIGINHETLKFWKQAKNLGSKLIVGIRSSNMDMIQNACSSDSVDTVITSAPLKLSLSYMNENRIDFVVLGPGQSMESVTTEVASSQRCLVIGSDGTVRPLEAKEIKLE